MHLHGVLDITLSYEEVLLEDTKLYSSVNFCKSLNFFKSRFPHVWSQLLPSFRIRSNNQCHHLCESVFYLYFFTIKEIAINQEASMH